MPKTKKTDRFAESRKKLADIKKEMLKIGQKAFAEESKLVFEQFPTLKAFSWLQYTPYWCDGDACTFSVDSYDFGIRLDGMEDIVSPVTGSSEEDDEAILEDNDTLAKEITKVLTDFIGGFDEDVMLQMFGDHAEVVVSSNGTTEVREYEHE